MAITKLMHIKERKIGDPAQGLMNCINYILNPKKTENGLLVVSNSGLTADEIFKNFIKTKSYYNKRFGRQGYHFIVSYPSGEKIKDSIMLNVMDDITSELLKDEYDYVAAVHNDTDHPHGHIVFNSVNSVNGKKYRYNNGDWARIIQPVVNKVSEKYNLPLINIMMLDNEIERGTLSKHKLLKHNIDQAVEQANNYEELLDILEKNFDIEVKEAYSKKYGIILKYKPMGETKYIRANSLGFGYFPDDLKRRLNMNSLVIKEVELAVNRNVNKMHVYKSFVSWDNMSVYQKEIAKKVYYADHILKRGKHLSNWEVNRTVSKINTLVKSFMTIQKNQVNSYNDLIEKIDIKDNQIAKIQKSIKSLNNEYKDYLKHSKYIPSLFELLKTYKVLSEDETIDKDRIKKIEKFMDVKKTEQAYNSYIHKKNEFMKIKNELQTEKKYMNKIKKELETNLKERKIRKKGL
ncbi:Relaxase/Mobilisation nuclease domain-containing protein [Eubacterium uniforme]|uniref:Relaxase/Mobilisation nuclease domain-containing protein n=1 Tax=Eubacterium uniforme TaxID=39495 RepID=A0A1T4W751_9FIRM|nr:relaxase/mobilization nuclease domain-containing protein [Eubacterium uniforme]SKA72939.1 Relaxase/Mobilisation nuclease domain-containing protein [Eubacterium uniforme]